MSIGIPTTEYVFHLNDPLGQRVAVLEDYVSFSVVKPTSALGVLSLVLPGYYNSRLFVDDSTIEVWRRLNGESSLLFETIWFVRRRTTAGKSTDPKTLTVTAYDPLYILGSPSGNVGRNIAYNANNVYTLKLDNSDDMCKAIVRENAGSLATDATRDLSTYLTVQPDVGAGYTLKKDFSRRNVLATLQEIAQASAEYGTYLAFDIICSSLPGASAPVLEFRTYTGQRGNDHRSSSNSPVLIGPDYGNLDNWELDDDKTDEVTYVYAGGQSVADVQAIGTAYDTLRMGVSPFNRRELYVNGSGEGDDVALIGEAQTALRKARVYKHLTGDLVNQPGTMFHLDWGYGDYLTAQVLGQSFDCRADVIQIDFSQKDGERISPTLRFDNV